MPTDQYNGMLQDLKAPLINGVAVTASDSVDLPNISRVISVNVSGLVTYTYAGAGEGAAGVQVYMVAGAFYPIRATRIWNTGTTASGIVAHW
jgi:hypothetical protein